MSIEHEYGMHVIDPDSVTERTGLQPYEVDDWQIAILDQFPNEDEDSIMFDRMFRNKGTWSIKGKVRWTVHDKLLKQMKEQGYTPVGSFFWSSGYWCFKGVKCPTQ